MIRTADHVIEVGPAAGNAGGKIVFEGSPDEMLRDKESLTGQFCEAIVAGPFAGVSRESHGVSFHSKEQADIT